MYGTRDLVNQYAAQLVVTINTYMRVGTTAGLLFLRCLLLCLLGMGAGSLGLLHCQEVRCSRHEHDGSLVLAFSSGPHASDGHCAYDFLIVKRLCPSVG